MLTIEWFNDIILDGKFLYDKVHECWHQFIKISFLNNNDNSSNINNNNNCLFLFERGRERTIKQQLLLLLLTLFFLSLKLKLHCDYEDLPLATGSCHFIKMSTHLFNVNRTNCTKWNQISQNEVINNENCVPVNNVEYFGENWWKCSILVFQQLTSAEDNLNICFITITKEKESAKAYSTMTEISMIIVTYILPTRSVLQLLNPSLKIWLFKGKTVLGKNTCAEIRYRGRLTCHFLPQRSLNMM